MKRLPLITVYCLLFTLFSCTSEQKKLENAIADKEKKLYGDSTMVVDFSKAKDIIALYADFAKKYPNDPKAEDYLFKAGEVSMGAHQNSVAIKYFEQYNEQYPKGPKAPTSLLYQGMIYEDQLNNAEKAREKYEKFINEFPSDKLANDVRSLIEHLGKSDEEIIREFEAMNKRDSLSTVGEK